MNKRPPKAQNIQTEPTTLPLADCLRSLWRGTCAWFTVLCTVLLLISLALSDSLIIEPSRFLLLLPFSFLLAAAALVRRAKRLPVAARCILHPILALGGFYLCCYLPYQINAKPSGSQIFLVLLLVAILYGVGMGIYLGVTYALNRKKDDSADYVSQFGKKS